MSELKYGECPYCTRAMSADHRCWQSSAIRYEKSIPDAWKEMKERVEKAEVWKTVVIDALVINHIYSKEHETNPRKAINDLIAWETKIALYPSISSNAENLIKLGTEKAEARVKMLVDLITKIRAVSCGEDIVPDMEVYATEDSDALTWIFHQSEKALAKIKEER